MGRYNLPEKLRQQIFERDKYRCMIRADRKCSGRGEVIDHRVARALGGSDEPINLQSSCKHCNAVKSVSEKQEVQRRKRRR